MSSALLSRTLRRGLAAGLIAGLALWATGACADDESSANVYVAGADVHIEAPVDGDLYAAAGRVSVDQPVSGDAVLAAGSVEVKNRIGDDLRAAGGIVSVAGRVAGEALIGGGSIAFGPNTEIGGRAWLAGSDIAVAGRLHDGLKAYGKNILIIGEIDGPVELTGKRIEVLGSARISGNLTYTSDREIRIDPGAQVTGTITRAPGAFEIPRPGFGMPSLPALQPLLIFGLLAAGILQLALFPRFTVTSLQTVGLSPLKSLGLGTAIFFSLPPVILLLVITIIGIPIAVALAALYAVALLVGYLVTAFFIGDRFARAVRGQREPSFGWRIGSLAAALLLLWLLRIIPYIGGFATFVALLAGLGAMVLQAFSNYSNRA